MADGPITTAEELREELQALCDEQFEAHKAFCSKMLAINERSTLDTAMHDAVGLAVLNPHYKRLEGHTPRVHDKIEREK